MNSLERVKAALTFNNPDKVPIIRVDKIKDVYPLIAIPSKHWKPGWNKGEEGLFPHVSFLTQFEWDRPDWAKNKSEWEGNNWKKLPHEEIDEWGCIWDIKGNDDTIGHPGRPSLSSWDDYSEYVAKYSPDASDKSRYSIAIEMQKIMPEDKYILLVMPTMGPSQVVSQMRGFNNYLLDHRKNPKELISALERVAQYHVDLLENGIKNGLKSNGIFVIDDLGEQNGPFFGPRVFRKCYESSYKKIIEGAHNLGVDVHLHCCGKIDPLLPALIEWGLDAIELDSPRMSGYNDLKPYRGKIMFWGCVNIQSIYSLGTPEEVDRETWHMIRNLGTPKGGFGAYFYPQPTTIRVPSKNIEAFDKALENYGDYAKIPKEWWNYPVSEYWVDNIVPPLPPI